jgi:hypothetical protein
MPDTTTLCRHDEHCAGWDRTTRTPATATAGPLCEPCLARHTADLRALLYDYVDLEQLHYPSLAQALTGQPNGSPAPAMPINGNAEALQAEIVWALTTWEREIRVAQRLHQPPAARPGRAVHRAVHTLTDRTRALATLPPRQVRPAGVEDPPQTMDGGDALAHLSDLHRRARAMLGRTRRVFWVPGECPSCDATPEPGVPGPLYRSEPRDEGDEPPVVCDRCGETRTYDDYERYVRMLVWPHRHDGDPA